MSRNPRGRTAQGRKMQLSIAFTSSRHHLVDCWSIPSAWGAPPALGPSLCGLPPRHGLLWSRPHLGRCHRDDRIWRVSTWPTRKRGRQIARRPALAAERGWVRSARSLTSSGTTASSERISPCVGRRRRRSVRACPALVVPCSNSALFVDRGATHIRVGDQGSARGHQPATRKNCDVRTRPVPC
jgi:hypothetical protein